MASEARRGAVNPFGRQRPAQHGPTGPHPAQTRTRAVPVFCGYFAFFAAVFSFFAAALVAAFSSAAFCFSEPATRALRHLGDSLAWFACTHLPRVPFAAASAQYFWKSASHSLATR